MSCETGRRMMESNDPAFAEHVRSCSSCFISRNARYYPAPAGLEERISLSLRRDNVRTMPWRWMAVAATVLLAVSAGWNVALVRSRVSPRQVVAEDVLSAHLRSLAGTHLLDVPTSDQHTVKPWFGGKLDFSPTVKEVAGFPLLGGRLEYFEGHPAAALVYGRRNHVINLFVWPSAAGPESAETRNGYHIRTWSGGGMAFWAVSDLNEAELGEFVTGFRQ